MENAMKKAARLLILILCFALTFTFFVSCKNTTPPDEPTTDDPADNPEEPNGLTDEQKFWRGVVADSKEYTIIRSVDLDDNPRRMALALKNGFQSVAGLGIKLYSDTNVEPSEKEIIIGVTERLGKSYNSTVVDSELDADEFIIEYFGKTAVVHYGGFEGLALAIRQIIGFICEPSGKDASALYKTSTSQAGVNPGNIALTNVYANGMIFQQNKPMVFKGDAEPGYVVTAKLCNKQGDVVASGTGTADSEGRFSITVNGQAGSYDPYKVQFSVASIDVLTLSDVVFGEVWVATGQSNLLYQLSADIEYKNLTFNDKYLKLLTIGKPHANGGYTPVPFEANQNPTVKWSNCNGGANGISAVAYYYAAKLRSELDVPVGIIQYAVGGVPIRSWLSEETIKSNNELFEFYKSNGTYVAADKWKGDNNDERRYASAFYNTMACLAEDFSIAGMIWYQGEQDVEEDASDSARGVKSYYLTELELLYSQYCKMYDFKVGEMPMIYNLLVPYRSSRSVYFGEFTARFATFAQKCDKVGCVAIYDQSPFYDANNTADHPNSKRLAGERMASSALSLVYGGKAPASSPSPVSYVKEDRAIIITFQDVADGLTINTSLGGGNYLKGFTVCGEDGVYVMANAEIIAKDKVKIYSPYVTSPVSVTYAYEILQRNCNLGCSLDGEIYNMAVPFCLGEPEEPHHTSYYYWMGCDVDKIWRVYSNYSYELPLWVNRTPADSDVSLKITYNTEKKHGGASSLSIEHSGVGTFGVGVTSTYALNNTLGTLEKSITYKDTYSDISRFSKLAFYVRCEGDEAVTLKGVTLDGYTAALEGGSSITLSPDGEWHRVVAELDKLTASGTEYTNSVLTSVEDLDVIFTSAADGVVLIDDFELIP